MTNPALLPGNTPLTVSGAPDARLTAGTIGRGVQRLLAAQGFESLSEFPLGNGRRADVIGLGPPGTIWIVEIKSSTADFRADHKWPEYRDYCDAFFFAVALDFPHAILPAYAGLILADAYGGEIVRAAPETPLAAARRKAIVLSFARAAAARLRGLNDAGQFI